MLVLGLGDSGPRDGALVRAPAARAVRVWDTREAAAAGCGAARARCRRRRSSAARSTPALLDGVRLVLKSPGLSPHDERIAPLLARRRASAASPVRGELDLFAQRARPS